MSTDLREAMLTPNMNEKEVKTDQTISYIIVTPLIRRGTLFGVTPSGSMTPRPTCFTHVFTEMCWCFLSRFVCFIRIKASFEDMDLASKDSYIQKLTSKVLSREQEPKKRPFGRFMLMSADVLDDVHSSNITFIVYVCVSGYRKASEAHQTSDFFGSSFKKQVFLICRCFQDYYQKLTRVVHLQDINRQLFL